MSQSHTNDVSDVSAARYALLRGWAKWLALYIDDLQREVRRIEKMRGTNFGIAVKSDYNALLWQIWGYRLQRAKYAVGLFGLVGRAHLTDSGWVHDTPDQINEANRLSMSKYRERAVVAVHKLRERGLFPCTECLGAGCFVVGDQDYPCERCQIHGVVELDKMGEAA